MPTIQIAASIECAVVNRNSFTINDTNFKISRLHNGLDVNIARSRHGNSQTVRIFILDDVTTSCFNCCFVVIPFCKCRGSRLNSECCGKVLITHNISLSHELYIRRNATAHHGSDDTTFSRKSLIGSHSNIRIIWNIANDAAFNRALRHLHISINDTVFQHCIGIIALIYIDESILNGFIDITISIFYLVVISPVYLTAAKNYALFKSSVFDRTTTCINLTFDWIFDVILRGFWSKYGITKRKHITCTVIHPLPIRATSSICCIARTDWIRCFCCSCSIYFFTIEFNISNMRSFCKRRSGQNGQSHTNR